MYNPSIPMSAMMHKSWTVARRLPMFSTARVLCYYVVGVKTGGNNPTGKCVCTLFGFHDRPIYHVKWYVSASSFGHHYVIVREHSPVSVIPGVSLINTIAVYSCLQLSHIIYGHYDTTGLTWGMAILEWHGISFYFIGQNQALETLECSQRHVKARNLSIRK